MNKLEKLIFESLLIESYKDYINKNEGRQLAKDVAKLHKELKNKIPEKEKRDIGYWMKEPPAMLWQYLHNLPETKREIEKKSKSKTLTEFVNNLKEDKNIEIIDIDNTIVTFAPKNFKGSSDWGSKTTDWCVTKAEGYWDEYTTNTMIVFIFDLSKQPYNIHHKTGDTQSKIAVLYDSDGDVHKMFDAADDEIIDKYVNEIIDNNIVNNIKYFVKNNFNKFSKVTADDIIKSRMNEQKGISLMWDTSDSMRGEYLTVRLNIDKYLLVKSDDITDNLIENIEFKILDDYRIEEYYYKNFKVGDFHDLDFGVGYNESSKMCMLSIQGLHEKKYISNTEKDGTELMDYVKKLSSDIDIFLKNIVKKYS